MEASYHFPSLKIRRIPMFCEKCGKEISNQANFCNFCGAKVAPARPQAAPAPQPAPKPQPAPAAQTSSSSAKQQKKKGTFGKTVVSCIVAVIVYFVVRYVTEEFIMGTRNDSTPKNNTSGTITLKNPPLTDSCLYGGLYQDGYLTYGLARVTAPGYSLVNGEGANSDYLLSADQETLISVNKQIEVGVSYEKTTEQSMLSSITANANISNAKMINFKKYTVDGYYVIRYIAQCTVNGGDKYFGELIVFPDASPANTLRFYMETIKYNGFTAINQVFDTLSISSAYALKAGDTVDFGVNQITQK